MKMLSLLPKQYEKEMEKLRQWVGGDDGTERVGESYSAGILGKSKKFR